MNHPRDLNGRTRTTDIRSTRARLAPEALDAAERTLARLLRQPGVVLAVGVVDGNGALVGTAAAGPGQPLILGRHSQCDLRLDDDTIPLRHLALLPRASSDGTRVDLWDLRTELPLKNAAGEPICGLSSEGSFSLTFSSYTLLVRMPAPRVLPLPRLKVREAPVPGSDSATITRATRPAYLDEDAAQGALIGHLESRCEGFEHVVRLPISSVALSAGLLVGRYERCAIQASAADSLSRVHLLVVEVDREPWIIDLASTNGTERNGRLVQASPIHPGDEVRCGALTLTWMPAAGAAIAC